jgi:hypothetical protein
VVSLRRAKEGHTRTLDDAPAERLRVHCAGEDRVELSDRSTRSQEPAAAGQPKVQTRLGARDDDAVPVDGCFFTFHLFLQPLVHASRQRYA